MKTLIASFCLSLILIQGLRAQNNNLVIYSQDGLKFTVILNGIRQNAQPETNVKITGLNAPNYKVKLIFENKMPDVDKNVYLMSGGENAQNTEYSYSVIVKKDEYKLRFNSEAPISAPAPPPADASASQQTVMVYSPVNAVAANTVTTTTTTRTTGTNTNNGGNVGVNMNGLGINMNINMNDGMDDLNTSNSTTTTSTTYSSTTTSSGGAIDNSPAQPAYVLQGYNGVYGCPYPMGETDFESAKQSVKSKGFDDSRLTIAKQIIGSNCLLCSQIKELMLIMSFEQTRLDLAKFAWGHNLDKGNYFKLNDAFTFETSINELNKYTQSH